MLFPYWDSRFWIPLLINDKRSQYFVVLCNWCPVLLGPLRFLLLYEHHRDIFPCDFLPSIVCEETDTALCSSISKNDEVNTATFIYSALLSLIAASRKRFLAINEMWSAKNSLLFSFIFSKLFGTPNLLIKCLQAYLLWNALQVPCAVLHCRIALNGLTPKGNIWIHEAWSVASKPTTSLVSNESIFLLWEVFFLSSSKDENHHCLSH